MEALEIKRGDTSPALRFALTPASVSLVGASVRFLMRNRAGTKVIDRAATIITATGTPTVEYVWQAGDTAIADLFDAEFRVTYADGSIETFPSAGFIPVLISENVA